MAQFNEQQEQLNDQKYLDGFNIGYQLERQLEDQSLSKKDRELIETLTNTIKKSKGDDDKLQGMKDGRKQRFKELEKEKSLQQQKDNNRHLGRER